MLGLIGALATVTVMAEREHAHVLVPTVADRRRPVPAAEPLDATVELGGSA